MRWVRVQPQGAPTPESGRVSVPGRRWGHTCNAIKGGTLVYVFGGYGKDDCQTNQVHVLDTAKQTWFQLETKGTSPLPRDSHSCTAVGDNLFIFGGNDGTRTLGDLHILDTSSHTWISPSIRGEGPSPREGHSSTLFGKRLFIFGGCGKPPEGPEKVYFNDLYILNTETFTWKHAMTSGTPPSPRDSHSCSSYNNKIIVISGEDENDYYLSDVHVLDTDTLVWRELVTSGHVLPPRAGHTTVSIGNKMVVFGGFTDDQNLYGDLHVLDVDTGLWTRVMATGDRPSARFSAAGDTISAAKTGVVLFMGGCSKHLEALDDVYYLHTDLLGENSPDNQELEKFSLKKQLNINCQKQYLLPAVHQVPTPVYYLPNAENLTLSVPQPQGKRAFRAKVTHCFPHGYTIETVIDGRPLRGILFSSRPSSIYGASAVNRKRKAIENNSCKSYNNQDLKVKTESPKQSTSSQEQTESAHEHVSAALAEPGKVQIESTSVPLGTALTDTHLLELVPAVNFGGNNGDNLLKPCSLALAMQDSTDLSSSRVVARKHSRPAKSF